MTGSPVIPLRPMTVTELLDSGAALLRARWRSLLGLSLLLATVEQIGMTTLRLLTIDRVRPRYYGEPFGSPSLMLLWLVVGLTSEMFIICLLAGPATRTAVAALTDEPPGRLGRWILPGADWLRVAAVAAILAAVGALGAVLCVLPWFLVWVLVGTAVPALIAERLSAGASILRSLRLVRMSAGRTAGIRLLAYATWLLVRFTMTYGAIVLVTSNVIDFTTVLFDYFLVVLGLAYLAVNTAGYALMACVDAVTLVEARVRYEGLDVAVARMRSHGRPIRLTAEETP